MSEMKKPKRQCTCIKCLVMIIKTYPGPTCLLCFGPCFAKSHNYFCTDNLCAADNTNRGIMKNISVQRHPK